MRFYKILIILTFINEVKSKKTIKHSKHMQDKIDKKYNETQTVSILPLVKVIGCMAVVAIIGGVSYIVFMEVNKRPLIKRDEENAGPINTEDSFTKDNKTKVDDVSVPLSNMQLVTIKNYIQSEMNSALEKISAQPDKKYFLRVPIDIAKKHELIESDEVSYPSPNLAAASIFAYIGGDQEMIWENWKIFRIKTNSDLSRIGLLIARPINNGDEYVLFPRIELGVVDLLNPSTYRPIVTFIKSAFNALGLEGKTPQEAYPLSKAFIENMINSDLTVKEKVPDDHPYKAIYNEFITKINRCTQGDKKALPFAIFLFCSFATPILLPDNEQYLPFMATSVDKTADGYVKQLKNFLDANDLKMLKKRIDERSFVNFVKDKAFYGNAIQNLASYACTMNCMEKYQIDARFGAGNRQEMMSFHIVKNKQYKE